MSGKNTYQVRGYCAQCSCWCPTVSHVQDGVFVKVTPDKEHPMYRGLCPKGVAAPELVYSPERLKYPLRRTSPKGAADPGWERISWDEALDEIAEKLNGIKKKYGAEAVAFTRAGPGGSPLGEISPWVNRLAHAFGSPNNIGTTNICQWHRDNCSVYTFARPGLQQAAGRAEFERARCILIWGNNVTDTRNSLAPLIRKGIEQGAKLIVIDPRRIEMAEMADLWLQVRPGTDGALALGMIHVVLEENIYDSEFTRDWTTAPFLVRTDNGEFLSPSELPEGGDPAGYVIYDSGQEKPVAYAPRTETPEGAALDGSFTVPTRNGGVECRTVFRLLREAVAGCTPAEVEKVTGVPREQIVEAARMFATIKPSCWYSWNGIEQTSNASQTNRAICILYALTGNYDSPGGNVILPGIKMNAIHGLELLPEGVDEKRLGFRERPLGPSGGQTAMTTQGYEVFRAVTEDKPYPVRALVGFGGNLATSNVPALAGRDALNKLGFHVQVELFMTPTAELADIVLPAASCWESLFVGRNMVPLGETGIVQARVPVVPPQGEARSDMEIIFELGRRLGLGERFWDGNVQAGFDYQLEPLDITVDSLRENPGGIRLNLDMKYRKFARKKKDSTFAGLPTPSGRVEIYSTLLRQHGYSPLPEWKMPLLFQSPEVREQYPLILTTGKLREFCHSQYRAIPSLRKRVPHPFLEINQAKAKELDISDGEWVVLETPYGAITLRAKLTDGIAPEVVWTQNGWWQACPELDLPGYDPFSPEGANVGLLYSEENLDPLSGSVLIKGHPCAVRKTGR